MRETTTSGSIIVASKNRHKMSRFPLEVRKGRITGRLVEKDHPDAEDASQIGGPIMSGPLE